MTLWVMLLMMLIMLWMLLMTVMRLVTIVMINCNHQRQHRPTNLLACSISIIITEQPPMANGGEKKKKNRITPHVKLKQKRGWNYKIKPPSTTTSNQYESCARTAYTHAAECQCKPKHVAPPRAFKTRMRKHPNRTARTQALEARIS